MRLNLNEIDKELEDSIADGKTLAGQSARPAIRVRPPGFGRGRRDAPERDRSRNRVRSPYEKEDSI